MIVRFVRLGEWIKREILREETVAKGIGEIEFIIRFVDVRFK